jgi:hypothetical protein
MRAVIVIVFVALVGCRQATATEVGQQSRRDAQGMAIMQASAYAATKSPDHMPEASKGGALQQPPMAALGRQSTVATQRP